MKILIGTLVAWYEVELLPLYLESLKKALEYLSTNENLKDVQVHFDFYVTSPDNGLEKEIESNTTDRYFRCVEDLQMFEYHSIEGHSNLTISIRYENTARQSEERNKEWLIETQHESIAWYRRNLNKQGLEGDYDFVVWGETDSLVPKTLFRDISLLYEDSKLCPLVATYSGAKMWDQSWKETEHVDFTDKPFIDGDTENWWSLKYNMTLDEMNKINEKYEDKPICISAEGNNIKFNGCGLIISKKIIESGANIYNSIFFIHEDTNFMLEIKRLCPDAVQIIFKNILMVHNRKSPLKRTGIQGEESINPGDVGAKRKTQNWYPLANKYSELNAYNYNNPDYIPKTWDNVWNDSNK